MENPPDLIVAFKSDDQYQDKKRTLVENTCQEQDKQRDELVANLQSDNYALQCELQQLRAQLAVRNNNEFDEQSRLLQQRFDGEIQSVVHNQTALIQHASHDLSLHVTDILQQSIENIESLRLLHQKELSTHSKVISDCVQHQSHEMNELCHHLIEDQRTNPPNVFDTLMNNFRTTLNDLKTSFNTKISYLSDIHSSSIDKLNAKHETEINEMKCELNLLSNRRN